MACESFREPIVALGIAIFPEFKIRTNREADEGILRREKEKGGVAMRGETVPSF